MEIYWMSIEELHTLKALIIEPNIFTNLTASRLEAFYYI